jgi:hypothetical protein
MTIVYTPTTNFGAKDSLPSNDPNKVVKGAEFTDEFENISTAFGGVAPTLNPTFTGTITADGISASSITLTGNASAVDVTASGDVTAVNVTYTGALSGPDGALATEQYATDLVNAAVLAPITELDDISDVNTTAATDGQYLKLEAGEWVGSSVDVNNITGNLTVSGAIIESESTPTQSTVTQSLRMDSATLLNNPSGYTSPCTIQLVDSSHWYSTGPNSGNTAALVGRVMTTPYDITTGSVTNYNLTAFIGGNQFVRNFHVSPDGHNLVYMNATSTHSPTWDRHVSVYTSIPHNWSGAYLTLLEISDEQIGDSPFTYSADGLQLFRVDEKTSGTDLRHWDLASPYQYNTRTTGGDDGTIIDASALFAGNVRSFQFNSDGTELIASVDPGHIVAVVLSTPYDFTTASVVDTFTGSSAQANVNDVALSPDGQHMGLGFTSTVEFYNISADVQELAIDCNQGNVFTATLTASSSIALSNIPPAGEAFALTLELETAGNSIQWPTGTIWPTATPPTLSAGKDVFVLTTHDGGTTWYGFTAGQEMG